MKMGHCLFPWCQVEVLNPDGTPAQGINVEVEPDEIFVVTKANGLARLSINTEVKIEPLTITVSECLYYSINGSLLIK